MLAGDVLDRIPTEPGVYLFKDARGAVIYVGKAKNLRTRVRQYFREGGDERFFVAAGFLGKAVADVETIVVTSSTCSAYAAAVTAFTHGPPHRLIWYCKQTRPRVSST